MALDSLCFPSQFPGFFCFFSVNSGTTRGIDQSKGLSAMGAAPSGTSGQCT